MSLRAEALRSATATGPGGKDLVVVAARETLAAPTRLSLPEPEPAPGLILADGTINWGCPCLGGMATGPCGPQFRDAFSCFHYSDAEPKGSDCYEKFSVMQECMSQFPELYGKDEDDDDDQEAAAALAAPPPAAATDAPRAPHEPHAPHAPHEPHAPHARAGD
ncbi:PREDICTED: mitochondrial intermembrane space import and assembly protein 40 [Papilio xuthus]|uniref:Mitochondrial intermembrane space import and assembly protein 40 n=1 Tax=Papilio xuthus TaxID=66420 RepID=A0AAJ6ZF27_PAPXU|nr:PREDICTED: mitochondrial intermembrane space import and assembly protein 40 [Papilio xuthus]